MRFHDIMIEAVKRLRPEDYEGLSTEEAQEAIGLGLSPANVRSAKANDIPLARMADYVRWDKEGAARRKREDTRFAKVSSKLDVLAQGTGILPPETVVMIIANDDTLWNSVANFTTYPDEFEENKDITLRIEALLMRMKPRRVSFPLWRGECTRFEEHERKFHSWTPSKKTATYFTDCGHYGSRMREIIGPFRGFALEELVSVRMRMRPGESHYSGMQAEWLVLDPPARSER